MIRLDTMDAEVFEAYLKALIPAYAEDNVKAGNWTAAEAEQKAAAQIEQLLPQGQQTEGQLFFDVVDAGDKQKVGILWIARRELNGAQVIFIYDILVNEAFRRRGYGRQAMRAVEGKAASWGVSAVWLNVFADNVGAKNMYTGLGYEVKRTHPDEKSGAAVAYLMAKEIVPPLEN